MRNSVRGSDGAVDQSAIYNIFLKLVIGCYLIVSCVQRYVNRLATLIKTLCLTHESDLVTHLIFKKMICFF